MPDIDIEINTPQIDADVGRSSTFIENDYNGLINHPSINGVELSGDKSLSDIGAASASDVAAALSGKVDKEAGKGLSSNDYTGPEKDKLAGVEAGAQVNVIESVSVNGTELAPSGKSVNVPVPTKTSDLSNDSNFPTDAEYVHTDNNFTTNEKNKLAAIESGAQVNVIESVYVNGDALVITSKGVSITIPTKVSDILNDSNFQTSAEVTAAIASAIGQITGISYSVVQELPQTGTAGVIYLVANSGSGHNIYEEYIYVNGAFEKIGTTEIDLTGYVRDANYVHTDNNYTNDEKSKLSGIASGAQVNIVESVKLNGTAITPDGNKAVNIQPGISVVSGLNDIIEKVYKDLPVDHTPSGLTNIELNDENIADYIGTKDIKYKEAIARESMIGAIAHSVILIRTEKDADIKEMKETILENVNPRKWVCVGVEKEDVIIKNKGDLLIVIIVEDEVGRKSISEGFDKLS